MEDLLFGIKSPFDFAKKLDREYQRLLDSTKSNNREGQIDGALNFSVAAWHLADRVWNYQKTKRILKQRGITGWASYCDYIFDTCPDLSIPYDLCILFKHSNYTPKTIKSAVRNTSNGISAINGIPISKITSVSGVPVSKISSISGVSVSAKDTLVVTNTDGVELDFLQIAMRVVTFWQGEMKSLST